MEYPKYSNRAIFATVKCIEREEPVYFNVSMKSLKNNENLCSHCPMRHECKRRLNMHIYPYEMLRKSFTTPKGIVIGSDPQLKITRIIIKAIEELRGDRN